MDQASFWYRQAALQDHDLAINKCKELGISLDDAITDREGLRKVLKCRIFPLNYLPSYKYTVICSNYKGKWILSRHKKRDTWETQGGHIEPGETPLEAAAAAVCLMGICGEKAYARLTEQDGNATYRNYIIDAIYNLIGEELEEMAKYDIF